MRSILQHSKKDYIAPECLQFEGHKQTEEGQRHSFNKLISLQKSKDRNDRYLKFEEHNPDENK